MADIKIVTRQLAALQRMDVHELREKHAELFGCECASSSLGHLRRRLAFRIQEVCYGGLTSSEKAILDGIAQKDPMAQIAKSKPAKSEIIQGTRFSRLWHGVAHEVIATGDGRFEYNGRIFKSISAVAKEITGTQWNGKMFFGIKQ